MKYLFIVLSFFAFSLSAVVEKEQLLELFPEDCQKSAGAVLDRIYEVDRQPVEDEKGTASFGFKFACSPETLFEMLKNCKDKRIVEFGGASGDISLLFTMAGAKEVVLNDLSKAAIRSALTKLLTLPKRFHKKMLIRPGSCFDLLEKYKEENERFDMVVARNLLHFFTAEETEKFVAGVKVITNENALMNLTFQASDMRQMCAAENFDDETKQVLQEVAKENDLVSFNRTIFFKGRSIVASFVSDEGFTAAPLSCSSLDFKRARITQGDDVSEALKEFEVGLRTRI